MSRAVLTIAALLLFAPNSHAQNRFWQYVKTHKILLAADALVVASTMADVASSVHCQKVNPDCIEGGFPLRQIYGPRPSTAAFYSFGALKSAGLVATAHVFFHYQNAKPDAGGTQYAFVLWIGPTCLLSGIAAQTAVNVASQKQARERLSH